MLGHGYVFNERQGDGANAVSEGTVNHFTLGTYRITYSYTDEKTILLPGKTCLRVVDTTLPS